MRQFLTQPRVKSIIIHPFVFAVFPAMYLYIHNMGKGYLGEAAGAAVALFLLAGALWLLANLLLRHAARSAIIVSLFFFLFFSYGHTINASATILEKLQLSEEAAVLVQGRSSQLVWLAAWGILFVTVSCLVTRLPNDMRTATNFLNVVALTLVAIMVVNFAVGSVNTFLLPPVRGDQKDDVSPAAASADLASNQLVDNDSPTPLPKPATTRVVEDRSRLLARKFIHSWHDNLSTETMSATSDSFPDIYYIILDMYARADFLREIYDVDNSEFLSFLTERGFYVADEARGNYPHTMLSLSSSLNLAYLDEVAEQVGTDSTNHWPLVEMIRNNKVSQLLRSQGYTIVGFPSDYGITKPSAVDIYLAPSGWRPNQFHYMLMESTPLDLPQMPEDQVRRELVLYVLDHLADAAEIDSPTFAFGYIPSPHAPFVFGANGEHVRSKPNHEYAYEEFLEAYVNQLRFVTKKVQDTIDEILTESPTPPVIIVQSDHGPNSFFWDHRGFNLPEKLSILNAYYFPDQDYESLSEDITPVNTFRIVFNQYLGTDYELLENRCYYSQFWDSPYLFRDVTDEVVNYK